MDLVNAIEELAALDDELHWFCPRSSENDPTCYDEDMGDEQESKEQKAARQAKVKEAVSRREKALMCNKLLAFDGTDALPYQSKLKECLSKQLTRCDVCIREYHRGREYLRTELLTEYAEEEVEPFMRTVDAMDRERIVTGLNSATETLLDLPPADRKITAAGQQGMYAMFEALNCIPFLNDEEILQKHFDKPFRLAQTKKKITLSSFVPGVTALLFSAEPDRRAWAERNYDTKKNQRPYHPNEFEFGVKSFLEQSMRRVNIISLDLEFLPIFWRAMRRIVSRLDTPLIQSNLRAMDANIYTAGLEHFQIDASHYPDLIATYKDLLQKDPTSFWDAMGKISPQSVFETICRSPRLEHALTTKQETNHGQQAMIEGQLSWMDTFIASINPANLVNPLRALLDLCLHRYQSEKYTHYASIVALKKGFDCLVAACNLIMKKVEGGPVYTHLVEGVARDHMAVILKELEGIEKKTEVQISPTQFAALQIIECLLAVDVKGLGRDRQIIAKTREVDHQLGISSLIAWKSSMGKIVPGHPQLPMAILSGLTGLLPLEPLAPSQMKAAPKPAASWNAALELVLTNVSGNFLERLDSFSPDFLVDILQDQKATRGIISLSFNGDKRIHNGALSVLKSVSGEDERRDCVMHVVTAFFSNFMSSLPMCMKTVADAQAYGPCSNMLKMVRDIYSCLCDSQDGLLRSRSLSTELEAAALRAFWARTWKALHVIFEQTENWSGLGYEKHGMQDFCRETMDFADFVFDQYSVVASALHAFEAHHSSSHIGRSLLEITNDVFLSISKWLRLRDEYLIEKAVNLTTKLLGRLHQVDIKVHTESSHYLEDILISQKQSRIKTKLTMNQKAQLQRALEDHLGQALLPPIDVVTSTRKKQSSLNGWTVSSSEQGSRSNSTTPAPGTKPRGNAIDVEKWSNAAERKKAQESRPPMQKVPSLAQQKAAAMQKDDQKNFLLKRKQALAEQEKQKKAAIAKANLGAGSGVSGIGNLGKDHSTGQTIMVDDADLDSDNDDDDDEDLDDDLFGPSDKPKKAQRPALDVSGTTGLKPEVKLGPTRIQRTARSAKDMRARLKPDLSTLHKHILGWDYFHDGDFPPGARQDEFGAVSNSFRDPSSYQQTFEPLLILEAWQGLVKERGENSAKSYEIQVKNRTNVDGLLEISSLLGQQENRDLSLMEGDIVLLSTAAKPAKDPKAPHCLARVHRVKRQPKAHLEVVYQVQSNTPLAGNLTPQTIIHGLKVQSITPLEREYGALRSLQFYDLCNQIVRAKPSPKIAFSERQVSDIQKTYGLNRAQSEAVNAALENEGFSLIQGPPGTGKTGTIKAIVGGLLTPIFSNAGKVATRITMPKANGNTNTLGDAPSKKLMVCAPSNAAIDEIAMRLIDGITLRSGAKQQINVVRIGRGEAIKSEVMPYTMEELVQKKMGGTAANANERERNAETMQEHKRISQELKEAYEHRTEHDAGSRQMDPADRKKLEETISQLRRKKQELGNRIDAIRDQEAKQGREQDLNKKRAQQAVIDEAHVICATLSGSGHDMFSTLSVEFETVIIDEAAQCVEASSLIPLKYGCVKCVMVGDPKQLPPTVFSKEAAKFQYEQSLFVRMQNNFPDDVHLLDTQYRMHPSISLYPSRQFYDCQLADGDSVKTDRNRPWHCSNLLAPYRFFDVKGQHKSAASGGSLVNVAEIDVAMALFERLMRDFKKDFDAEEEKTGKKWKIGVIATYKAQHREMKSSFIRKYGASIEELVDFNTTDAFQGRECEIIIFSCVRASPVGGIGFLQDIRRMNVGLTRAKSSLWVLGNSESLGKGEYWRKLIQDARDRDSYITGNLHQMLGQPPSAHPWQDDKLASMLDINNHQVDMAKAEARRLEKPDADMYEAPTQNASIDAGGDKMEGIQYKFSDRKRPSVRDVPMEDVKPDPSDEASNKKRKISTASLDGASDMPPQARVKGDGDRRSSNGGSAPGSASGSRTATPNPDANGKPRPQAKPLVREPPKVSPFMPKKKQRPPPR